MIQKISSIQNPGIKNLTQLSEKSRVRKEQNLFIIEGEREITRAKAGGYKFESCYFCPEILSPASRGLMISLDKEVKLYEVSQTVYSKIAYRENADGIIVSAYIRHLKLENLRLKQNPLILILESIEKPGNIGAVLRTADAAALDAVIICDPQTDIYNPNVVRSSLGCLFSNSVVICSSMEAIAFLKNKGISIFAAALQNSVPYHLEDFTKGTAFVMGSEADGLSETWRKEAYRIIQIPMAGIADSLNVSVSAAVLVFEAVRQRNIKNLGN
jgi:RNA methyltransferase, TrmH family